jgi:hypothetical protein
VICDASVADDSMPEASPPDLRLRLHRLMEKIFR